MELFIMQFFFASSLFGSNMFNTLPLKRFNLRPSVNSETKYSLILSIDDTDSLHKPSIITFLTISDNAFALL